MGVNVSTYWHWLDLLKTVGLPTSSRAMRVVGIDAVLAQIAAFAKDREELPFATDGMVVKVDDFSLRELLGTTSKSPRWAMAFKYAAEQVSTKLLSVTWQVGKNGQLTPVAELEPVFVSGTTVRRATLHNMDQVRRLGVHDGDTLVVEKAGEIIPYIVRVDGEHQPGALPIAPPELCPSCGAKVVQEEGTPILRCDNPQCPDQLKERLRWFCGRNQMDIEGMGEKIIEQLVDSGQVKTFADLFLLKSDALAGMERMGEKSAANLLASLEQAKTRSLDRLLAGLGIRHVGVGGGRALAARFATLDELAEASLEQLSEVRDVGTIVAQRVKDFFSSEVGREIVRSLKAAGVTPTSALPAGDRPQPFAGKTIVVTGSLKRFGRDEIERLIATLGGKPSGSVSKKTAFLVAGQDAGSKLAKAKDLGVEIIDEEEFARRAGV
jgi:DNA ligase (NAD+)